MMQDREQAYHFIADIPVYVSLAWLHVANLIPYSSLPDWEQFFYFHGWFILLAIRLANAAYDAHNKLKKSNQNSDSDFKNPNGNKDGFLTKIAKQIERLW